MKKIILILLISVSCYHEDIEIGRKYDYSFSHNIEVSEIEEILYYTANHLEYVLDIEEYWQLPEESYVRRRGDCEDFCIFSMYLLYEKLGIEANLFLMTNISNGFGHAVIEINGDIYEATMGIKINKDDLLKKYICHDILTYSETMWVTFYYHGLNNIY